MSLFTLFVLLFVIVLYAVAWHDKLATQHVINKHPDRRRPGAEKEGPRIQPTQTNNYP